jgi:GDP-4-dehydro-6-deoxy-D-mannose reductase
MPVAWFRQLDITDADAVVTKISRSRPMHVVHLAGIAAIPEVSANVLRAWTPHLFGTLNLARAILKHAPDRVLIFAGSEQVYGDTAKSGLPLDETAQLAPVNEYATSKAVADLALGAFAKQGLRVVRFRPFNHTAPGQTEDFVVPSFAAQIARIEAGRQPPVIRVGNLEAQRDFLDVRDVAATYALAVRQSSRRAPFSTWPPGFRGACQMSLAACWRGARS